MPGMRMMLNRIRRLEALPGSVEKDRASFDAIRDAIMARRRGGNGPDYKDSFADLPPLPLFPARDLGEAIVRARERRMELRLTTG